MKEYYDMILLAAIVVFVVDYSGFTQSWKNLLGRWLCVKVGAVKPFDCSLCMTWWACVIYLLCTGAVSFRTIAFAALLAALSRVVAALYRFIVYALDTALCVANSVLDYVINKLH